MALSFVYWDWNILRTYELGIRQAAPIVERNECPIQPAKTHFSKDVNEPHADISARCSSRSEGVIDPMILI